MKKIFVELQKASGLKNLECAMYLGISEGAVNDRRMGTFEPRRSELIALAIYGSEAEVKALNLIQSICEHEIFTTAEGDKVCRVCKQVLKNE